MKNLVIGLNSGLRLATGRHNILISDDKLIRIKRNHLRRVF